MPINVMMGTRHRIDEVLASRREGRDIASMRCLHRGVSIATPRCKTCYTAVQHTLHRGAESRAACCTKARSTLFNYDGGEK